MKQRVTAAIVIINSKGDILGCHATGKGHSTGFDFPKGLVEPGESHITAALRELYEETNLRLGESSLIDAGVHPHNKEKDIHIFIHKTEQMPDPAALVCNSFYELNGKQYPECDFFEIIQKSEREKFNRVLQNKFDIIDSINSK